MKTSLPALVAFALLAPAEAARGDGADPTLEIVTFRLAAGTNEAAFVEAARETESFLRSTEAVTGRWLTKDADGLWTDVVLWTSRDAALAASAEAMETPAFAPFMAAIDPESVDMRHAGVLWQME